MTPSYGRLHAPKNILLINKGKHDSNQDIVRRKVKETKQTARELALDITSLIKKISKSIIEKNYLLLGRMSSCFLFLHPHDNSRAIQDQTAWLGI